MGIISDGNKYGVADDLIYSFPCVVSPGGSYKIVDGLELGDLQKEKLKITED